MPQRRDCLLSIVTDSLRRSRRFIAVSVAFLLAIAFSPMLLATGSAVAQTAPSADVELIMNVNGVFPPDEAIVYVGVPSPTRSS